jgi:tetratricopeptide (TPR) repeat protein
MNETHSCRQAGRKRWAVPLLGLLFLTSLACRHEQDPPRVLQKEDLRASSKWWQESYEPVPETDPLVLRARKGFERMQATTGQRAMLLILEIPGGPSALALGDDTVVLNREGLSLCYRNVSPETGDALLAFVLGHELRHLSGGDLWHASTFLAVRAASDGSEKDQDLVDLLRQDVRNRKILELRADGQGVLAMMMEDYDPNVLFEGDESFFEEWVSEVPGRVDPGHPDPAERVNFLRKKLQEVAETIHLFHDGVAAFDSGDYEKEIDRLDQFRQHFAGREVLNDLALAHYQLAAAALAGCDGTLVDRYRLPVALDPKTLAERARLRGGERSGCFESSEYHGHMMEARSLLEQAAGQDLAYLLARLNLVAACALDQQGAAAIKWAQEALQLAPGDPRALEAVQVAGLVYADNGSSLIDPATVIEALADLHRRFPDDPDVAYNLASALSYHRRLDEAKPLWRGFLRLEPEGPWADNARNWLGEDLRACEKSPTYCGRPRITPRGVAPPRRRPRYACVGAPCEGHPGAPS